MQGSKEWKELKVKSRFISGTSIQSICNEHPYKNADDIFNEINGIVPHFKGNADSKLGNMMEDKIVDLYRLATNHVVQTENPMFHYPMHENIGISPDGIIIHDVGCEPLEIKYAARRKIIPGVIPLYYAGQLQLTMAVCSSIWGVEVNSMTFVQTDASLVLDIIKVAAEPFYLQKRMPKLLAFVDRVNTFRRANPNWLENYWAWE